MRLEGRLICGMDIVHAVIDFGPIGSYIDISNYYTKTESDARFHPLYGKRTLNMNADNVYLNRLNMINADGGEDAYLTNHTSRGNKILVGNGRKVTELPWPTNDGTWTVALTKDHYSKSATDSLLGAKQDTLASGTNIKTVGGESLLPSSSTNTNVKPQYIFEATVTDGVVTCSETWESLQEMIFTKGKSVAAKVGTRIYTLHNASGVAIVFKNLSENTIRTLTCGSMSSPTWSFSSKNLQDELESGTNIKTINGNSLLGSGNINISGGSGSGVVYVTVTENSGVFTADKTFAEVDAALTAGQLVRFFDGTNYFDITGYIATMVVVASYTTGATNEKFTYTPSDLTWERTFLQVRTGGTSAERNNHSPVNLELYYDTTLNKLLICTDAQNRTWKDTMGNTI